MSHPHVTRVLYLRWSHVIKEELCDEASRHCGAFFAPGRLP